MASIAAAVAAGELTATEAAELAKVVDSYVGALASRGFEERLSKLENGISDAPAVPGHAAACDDTTCEPVHHRAAHAPHGPEDC